MEHGDGEPAEKREKPYAAGGSGGGEGKLSVPAGGGGGEDRLSALPGDILVQILLLLGTSGAARTSVLSRRWRLLWCLLPALNFPPRADGNSIRTALAAHEDSLHHLRVLAMDTGVGPMAEWLPVAARRLSGDLYLLNSKPKRDSKDDDDGEEEEAAAAREGGAFLELPCFGGATSLKLDLGFLGFAVPPSGVFARLTKLSLSNVWFRGPCELGDVVSSPRFPSLKKLVIRNAHGLSDFAIHSKSLLKIVLGNLKELQQLSVVAPALQVLSVLCCFVDTLAWRQPVVDIAAPKLEILRWSDAFDPSTVQFGNMPNLQRLSTHYFLVYGPEDSTHNQDCLTLLQRFQFDAIPSLSLMLAYLPDIIDSEYLMEDMTVLPNIAFLNVKVFNTNRHCIGPSLFHILRMCTGLRGLKLVLGISDYQEVEAACESDCVCDLPPNWTSEKLVLNFLHEVEINNLRGTENEITFVKRLFSWAAVLKEMTINFYDSITETIAKELCKKLLSFTRPEIHMKFYIDRGGHEVLYVPEE